MAIKSQQRLPPLTLEILDIVRFVQYQKIPFFTLERTSILHDELIAGDNHVEGPWLGPALSELLASRRWVGGRGGSEGGREGGREGGLVNECTGILHDELIAGDNHVEGPWLGPALSDLLAGEG